MTGEEASSDPRVAPDDLRRFVREVLGRAGVADEHATTVADALVRADLRGVDSHGVARLDAYVRKFEGGGFNVDPEISVEQVADAAALVDADDGPGQSAGVEAIDAAMDLAEDCGIGIAAVTNSNHFGTAAYYTERASRAGFLGVAMTNVESDVAPFGGVHPFLGTNPISVSIPTGGAFPITLDMATSVVARGKIDHANDEDDAIPETWAFDDAGEPTTDPDAVGALRPVGGPKGYGLAIVVDVLCGVLTGVGTSPTIGPLYDDVESPMKLGHSFAAIDPSAFRSLEAFTADVDDYVERLKAQKPRDGADEIRLPGELEALALHRNEREGVPLNDDAVRGIRSLSDRYDVHTPQGLT